MKSDVKRRTVSGHYQYRTDGTVRYYSGHTVIVMWNGRSGADPAEWQRRQHSRPAQAVTVGCCYVAAVERAWDGRAGWGGSDEHDR